MLLPGNFIYQMSSWTRAIVVPLSIIHAMNPSRPVPEGFDLKELFVPGGTRWSWLKDREFMTWRNVFLSLDAIAKFWEKYGSRTDSEKGDTCGPSNGCWSAPSTPTVLGRFIPPMQYVIMALDLLGYAPDHPGSRGSAASVRLADGGTATRILLPAVLLARYGTRRSRAMRSVKPGCAPQSALNRMADWLLTKEVRRKGDWSVKRPNVEPSGWYFEFANEFYPDIDDTAMVLLSLLHARASNGGAHDACVKRAVNWLIAMQVKDGGWAAFDVDNNWEPLSYVPFADHNAMLDPTCPDITGRVLEALCKYGAAARSSGGPRGCRLSDSNAGAGRLVVRALGRELCVRNVSGACVG